MSSWRAGAGGGLLHPVPLIAIAVLVANDHWLKAAWAHPLTGRLSDVAGLVFFPLLLVGLLEVAQAALGRYRAPSDRTLGAAVAATAAVFAAVQLVPAATEAYRVALAALQDPLRSASLIAAGTPIEALPRVAATADAWDLAALPALVATVLVGRRASRERGSELQGPAPRTNPSWVLHSLPSRANPRERRLIPSLREKCGVFGVFAPGEDVARLTFFGLHSLQHRGQEAAGIATTDGDDIYLFAEQGLVTQIFHEEQLAGLPGYAAIGHTRYSTTGSSISCNAQPFIVDGPHGRLAFAHNGNVVNAELLRDDLLERGAVFQGSTDSEVLAHMLATGVGETWEHRFAALMRRANGAYSVTVLTHDAVFAARDPMGIRPLCIGRLNGGWVFASESCALDHLGATYVRDIEPGEVVRADATGLTSTFPIGRPTQASRLCLLEQIYIARPDSYLGGERVHPVRQRMGAQLAREHPVEADLVIGVPDSATAAAIGYAQESGIPYAEGLVKNRYVGRTFIQPDQRLREQGVQLKFNPLREVLEGKRVIVVDDSIVRGTTTPRVVAMIRGAGASEVHMRITSPQITHPCFYGVDMASKAELIASRMDVEAVRRHIDADSLGHLSIEGTLEATNQPPGSNCTACFTGLYPGEVPLQLDKFALEVHDTTRDRHAIPLRI